MTDKLWSHSVAQGSGSPREQWALSRRYGSEIVIVVPLKDGSFALFGADRQLQQILEEAPSAEALRAAAAAGKERIGKALEADALRRGFGGASKSELSLDELL